MHHRRFTPRKTSRERLAHRSPHLRRTHHMHAQKPPQLRNLPPPHPQKTRPGQHPLSPPPPQQSRRAHHPVASRPRPHPHRLCPSPLPFRRSHLAKIPLPSMYHHPHGLEGAPSFAFLSEGWAPTIGRLRPSSLLAHLRHPSKCSRVPHPSRSSAKGGLL